MALLASIMPGRAICVNWKTSWAGPPASWIGTEAITPEHLPDFDPPIRTAWSLSVAQFISATTLDEIERETLLQSARACKGNINKMVGSLGVSRTTLWRKFKQYQINIREYRPQNAN